MFSDDDSNDPVPLGGGAVVLCKWQPGLVRGLLESGSPIYVILDDFDASHLDASDRLLLGRVSAHYHVTSFDSTEEVTAVAADVLLKGVPVRRVFGHTDFAQLGVGILESLWHPTDAGRGIDRVARLRDKRLMKKALAREGVRVARSVSIASRNSHEAIAAAEAQLRFPVVVKPVMGFGAMTTIRVDDPRDLAGAITALPHEPLFHSRQLVVEEYVRGTEYHVDALWVEGAPAWFTVGKYHVPRLEVTDVANRGRVVEGSFIVPRHHANQLYEKARVLHRIVNPALGIWTDPTHLEFFETAEGDIVFSEVAVRVAGGGIPLALTRVLGGDVWELVGRAMATGELRMIRTSDACAGVMIFGPTQPGTITEMPTAAELEAIPGVVGWECLRRVGDIVEHVRTPYHRSLFVALEAPSPDEYEAIAARLLDEIHIEVEPA